MEIVYLKRKIDLDLVHIHANNYSLKEFDQFPDAIELTISNINKLSLKIRSLIKIKNKFK